MAATEADRSERLMAMGEMAASLAHEIRNPLGSMELYCTLLKKDLHASPQAFDLAEKIHAGIKTIDRIISNSLQFSRDVTPRRKQMTDVRPLLTQVINFVQPKADALAVRISCKEDGAGVTSIDPFLINQVLLNVVLNAIEAAADGAKDIAIVEICSELKPDGWKVAVSDNGPGIPETERGRIFDPFYTTKQGGTGLGLPIVHSIVKAHGGKIDFESSPESGTVFTLVFSAKPECGNCGKCREINNQENELSELNSSARA